MEGHGIESKRRVGGPASLFEPFSCFILFVYQQIPLQSWFSRRYLEGLYKGRGEGEEGWGRARSIHYLTAEEGTRAGEEVEGGMGVVEGEAPNGGAAPPSVVTQTKSCYSGQSRPCTVEGQHERQKSSSGQVVWMQCLVLTGNNQRGKALTG